MAGALSLSGLVKRFGDEVAVDGLDLEIGEGEFFSLLGSSGCGKTTTLRMIAGFERPDEGRIELDGVDLSQVAAAQAPGQHGLPVLRAVPLPRRRRERRASGCATSAPTKDEVRRRVGAALDLVQMGALSKRKPHQLSGGQQQRVALARALVLEPTVLLLDEPMGALDAKLRKQLQLELRSLQKTVGTTFVYVTHDQDEALTMSDRLAVLDHGQVMQVGTPSEVYSTPAEHPRRDVPRHHQPLGGRGGLGATATGCCCRIGEVDLRVNGDRPAAGRRRLGDGAPRAGRSSRRTPARDDGDQRAARPGRHPDLPRSPHRGATSTSAACGSRPRWPTSPASRPTGSSEGADVSVHVSPRALRVLASTASARAGV